MIHTLTGEISIKRKGFVVIDVAGVGYRVVVNQRVSDGLLDEGQNTKIFCHLRPTDGSLDLYGFRSEEELFFFEQLITVSGVGPKSALAIMEIAELERLAAAITEGRADLLSKASGVGKKTAERIVLELRGKIVIPGDGSMSAVQAMEADGDLISALAGLGYRREEAKAALAKVPNLITNIEQRLKEALKILNVKKQ